MTISARVRTSAVCAGALLLLAVGSPAADARSCADVKNPYAGTRYEGVDLTGIRATGTSCATARRVAKGAHRKALGMTPPAPIRRYRWKGWRVRGDLRPQTDRYVAKRGGATVRWRF